MASCRGCGKNRGWRRTQADGDGYSIRAREFETGGDASSAVLVNASVVLEDAREMVEVTWLKEIAEKTASRDFLFRYSI